MNSIFKMFVLQPVEEGYIPHEVVDDNYQKKDGEILLSIEERPISGYKDQTYIVEFLLETDVIEINNWKLPKVLIIGTHHPGSYSSTSFNAICLSPDGLKVEINYRDESASICSCKDAINLVISKLWITSCETALELSKFINVNFRSKDSYSEEELLKMLKSVAALSKKIDTYKPKEELGIDVLWAMKKEYKFRLEKLLKIVS